MNKKNNILLLTLLALPLISFCQQATDTAAIIKAYTKVMAFTSEPYLYYHSITKMDAMPVLEQRDTATLVGDFYKDSMAIYSNSGVEEMYLQDSLMLQINNDRKTIWISKVEASTQKQSPMPIGNKEIQSLLNQHYLISQIALNSHTNKIVFESHKRNDSTTKTYTNISLEYDPNTFLPQSMLILASMKQPMSEEMLTSLKEQQVDETKLVKEINGVKYMVRTQQMLISFMGIENNKDKIQKMPSYRTCVMYNKEKDAFNGQGKYEDYEVTKLF
jgi:hypothetical protein